jgi:hypothetical protein
MYVVDGEKVTPHYNATWEGDDRPMHPTERLQLCHGCGAVFITSRAVDKCERCSKRTLKQIVTWEYGDTSIVWEAHRTPALGWNTITLLEALADSAAHTVVTNPARATTKLNDILRILRKNIEIEKARARKLVSRCPYRETMRTRCNRHPVLADGYCKLHSKLARK